MRYTVSTGRCSKTLFSKVLSLALHAVSTPVLLVQEGMEAKGLSPAATFLGCGSGWAQETGLQACPGPRLLPRLGRGAAAGDGTPV